MGCWGARCGRSQLTVEWLPPQAPHPADQTVTTAVGMPSVGPGSGTHGCCGCRGPGQCPGGLWRGGLGAGGWPLFRQPQSFVGGRLPGVLGLEGTPGRRIRRGCVIGSEGSGVTGGRWFGVGAGGAVSGRLYLAALPEPCTTWGHFLLGVVPSAVPIVLVEGRMSGQRCKSSPEPRGREPSSQREWAVWGPEV